MKIIPYTLTDHVKKNKHIDINRKGDHQTMQVHKDWTTLFGANSSGAPEQSRKMLRLLKSNESLISLDNKKLWDTVRTILKATAASVHIKN